MATAKLLQTALVSRVATITPNVQFRVLSATNVTNSSALATLSAVADTITEPQNSLAAGRLLFTPSGGSLALFKFFGTDAANETAVGRIWAWHQVYANDSETVQWTKQLICAFTLTLGAKTGVASGIVNASQFYVDTIAITDDGGLEPNGSRVMERSAADDSPVILVCDLVGAVLGEVELSINSGTAASVNAMVGFLSGT